MKYFNKKYLIQKMMRDSLRFGKINKCDLANSKF